MEYKLHDEDEDIDELVESDSDVTFTCPNDGVISRDDVAFLCNTCEQDELIYKDGIYICPQCLTKGENFQCMICDSKEVVMNTKL